MTKEGMNHAPTDAEIDAAILRVAEVVGEEARKGLGLPLESATDPAAVVVEDAAPVKPAAVDVAPKAGKDIEPKRQSRRRVADKAAAPAKQSAKKKVSVAKNKDVDDTVIVSPYGPDRDENEEKKAWRKNGKKLSKEIAAQTGADKVVVEKKKVKEAPVIAGVPEWGVAHDSVCESRTTIPAALDRTIVTSATLGRQEMTPAAVGADEKIPVLTDVVKETDASADSAVLAAQATEAARARLEQIQEEEGSIEHPTARLRRLRGEVAEARAKYASRMYEHNRLTEQLRRSPIGRFLKKSIGEADADMPDLEYWRLEYEEKLVALREAELEGIKESGLKGQALKEAMAGLLRASKVDEVLSLISDRDTYRLEGNELSDKVYNAFRSISEKYNKLPLKYKVMAGAAVGLLALSTAVYGGAALGAGAMAVRRFVSSAGFSVAIDAALDAKAEARLKKQAEEEIMAELEQMFDPVGPSPEGVVPSERPEEGMMQAFEERLRAVSGGVTLVFEDQLSKRKLNGVAGVALGTIAGSAGSAAMEWFKESGAADATHDIVFGQETVPVEMTEAELAERTAAARDMAEEYGGASPERQLEIRSATSMTDGQLSALAKTIQIEGGDFGSDAPAASVIDNAAIDAEERELARMAAEGPNAAAEETGVIDTSKLTPEQLEAFKTETEPYGSDVHNRMEFIDVPPEAGAKIPTVVTEELKAELAAEFRPRVNDWFSQIFRVDGEMPGSGRDWVFDREKLANTKISDMIRDAVLYQKGEASGFRTNLSAEQLKNFAQFFQNAGTGIGDQKAMAGIIYDTMRNKDMTVMDYLEKVAPIAKQGQRFGLFTTSV